MHGMRCFCELVGLEQLGAGRARLLPRLFRAIGRAKTLKAREFGIVIRLLYHCYSIAALSPHNRGEKAVCAAVLRKRRYKATGIAMKLQGKNSNSN
jgi:hypothetical protein